ncbi:MAG: TRAP transporter fused permease subunit [Alphaproteobacteria bacterium]|nr:TRAP transporter fused permease subunit [Alphaproteobacteria bacterium]
MRALSGGLKTALSAWAAAAAALHLYYAGHGFPEPLQQRAMHLLLFVPLVFLLYPARAASPQHRPSGPDWLCAVAAVLPNAYIWFNTDIIYDRVEFVTPVTDLEFALGIAATALVIEAIRRAVTPILAAIVVLSLLYMVVCEYLPGLWHYRDVPPRQIIETMYLINGSGLYGTLTGISASIVAVFLVFGTFVQGSGMGRLFNNFGLVVAGRLSGGPAKVAVISSCLFGTISGSSVANVVTTGAITIPMMKRLGFRPAFAGAVEATSSVGGAIMPPIMGAAAFVMAEIISVPYSEIIIAAALPAVLYYASILMAVHFEAQRLGLKGMAAEDVPHPRVLLADAHLVLPIVVLVVLMMQRWSTYYAAYVSALAMIVVSWLRAGTRMSPRAVFHSLAEAGTSIAILAVAVAGAGMISAAFTVTGTFVAFSAIIQTTAGDSLLLLGLLLMVFCLILGMGVPTTPAYIITAAIGGPLLARHGIPPIAAHLFIFYFAVLADATPPVAVASYAAAAIAKASPMLTGIFAARLAVGGFVCGIGFLYEPALILAAPLAEILFVVMAMALGLFLVNAALAGHVGVPLPFWMRAPALPLGLFCALAHGWPEWQRAAAAIVALGTGVAWMRLHGRRSRLPC